MRLTKQPHGEVEVFTKTKPRLLRQFQWKYTAYLLGATLISVFIVGGTTLFINHQNYELFSAIAFRHAPDLISNLEREKNWISGFLFISMSAIIGIYIFIGIRTTARLIIPILLLQTHLKNLTRGNLKQAPIRIREGDEFQDLIDTYNYFYSSFQLQIRRDLQRLQTLPIDARNREAQNALLEMIEEKRNQVITPAEAADSTLDSRHAS